MPDRSYEHVTQLLPAAAALAPLTVIVLIIARFDDMLSALRSILGIAVAAGFHLIAMRIVRDRGNRVQAQLWNAAGGSPTVHRLRWGASADTERLHRRVSHTTGVLLPSRQEQDADPAAADGRYEYAVSRLREMTRDHDKYPRLWSELKQYGTARNMYGAKPFALWVALLVLMASITLLALSLAGILPLAWWLPGLAAVFSILAGTAWLTVVNEAYVHTASTRYAEALLAAPDEPTAAAR